MKYYIDTCVYLDYLENRKNKQGKNLGVVARKLFNQSRDCKFQIILSDHLVRELERNIVLSSTRLFFESLKKKIIKIKVSEEDLEKAHEICENKKDFFAALHYVLAKRAKADKLITRNLEHFQFDLSFKPYLPEDVL